MISHRSRPRDRLDLGAIALRIATGEAVDFAEVEDVLARNGIAVVSIEMSELSDRIIASPDTATWEEISAFLYAVYASRYGDYWPCKVFA